MDILRAIKGLILHEDKKDETFYSRDRIADEQLAESWTADPEFPFLVSFSRTGSHWLRMLMELYFDRPSLRLLFFKLVSETTEYTCYHTHDLDLKVVARNVVYLYRNPVDTIFSQMVFHGQDIHNIELLEGWTELYARHLYKWLIEENFTKKKVILSYEGMKKNLPEEFRKLSEFFGVPFLPQKINEVSRRVSKEKIREKTGHDPRVINLDRNYELKREEFREMHSRGIYVFMNNRCPNVHFLE